GGLERVSLDAAVRLVDLLLALFLPVLGRFLLVLGDLLVQHSDLLLGELALLVLGGLFEVAPGLFDLRGCRGCCAVVLNHLYFSFSGVASTADALSAAVILRV